MIDPDLFGDLTNAEWHSFMSSTDGELEQRQVEANSEGQQAVAQGARQVINDTVVTLEVVSRSTHLKPSRMSITATYLPPPRLRPLLRPSKI